VLLRSQQAQNLMRFDLRQGRALDEFGRPYYLGKSKMFISYVAVRMLMGCVDRALANYATSKGAPLMQKVFCYGEPLTAMSRLQQISVEAFKKDDRRRRDQAQNAFDFIGKEVR